jgi:hypothetical protein
MPTNGKGSQRKEDMINGGGSAKAAEAVWKIGFTDTKSWMERRIAKLRSGIPNSGDPMLDPVGEAVVITFMGGHLKERSCSPQEE